MITNNNIYIMNLNSAYLYKDYAEGKEINIYEKDNTKLFSATTPYSLEIIRIYNRHADEFYSISSKVYTQCLINIEFGDKYYTLDEYIDEKTGEIKKKRKTIANSKKIRKHFYNFGFLIGDQKYVFYKRGAGKAKNGDALFIKEQMLDYFRKRSRLGLDFSQDKEIDFTSLFAYDSLITSGLEMTIDLDPKKEILLISDLNGMKFKTIANVTEEINGELVSNNKEIEIQNSITDGHGFLDESVFKKYGKKNNSFMLLRSDFLKSCAFNTKLQKFFSENKVDKLYDMFGREYNSKDIKLVITPNSLKFLKLKNRFNSEKECYEYYLDNIDSTFGVVKFDKRGNYGNYNRTTYQLLNSIPYLTRGDLKNIAKDEINYINMLQNDNSVFLNYIGMDAHTSIKYDVQSDEDSKLDNIELMNALLLVNSDIQYTAKFKKMKKELIKNRINHLLMGKIRLENSIYATIISNPYEMLLHVIGKYDSGSIMNGREVWCPQYEDGQEFCCSRNPHINAGNVMHTKNVKRDEYKWFNFSKNICVINFYDNDAPDRLQGCDTDSDTVLLLPNKILSNYANMCEENFPTPVNRVKGEVRLRKNNMNQLAELDVLLSENYIGRIINLSQIINSYLNHAIKNNYSNEIINKLYDESCKCSSLSQIEIDKSKKSFDNVNMPKELLKIKQCDGVKFSYEDDNKKMVVPDFFNRISEFDEFRIFEKMDTPMDYLSDILIFDKAIKTKTLTFKDLVLGKDILNNKDFNSSQRQVIFDTVSICGKKINGLRMSSCRLSSAAKKTIEKNAKNDAIEKLNKLIIIDATILDILRMSFGIKNDEYGFTKYSLLTLNLLFLSNTKDTLKCFMSKDMSGDDVLIKNKCGKIDIFGINYTKIIREDIEI